MAVNYEEKCFMEQAPVYFFLVSAALLLLNEEQFYLFVKSKPVKQKVLYSDRYFPPMVIVLCSLVTSCCGQMIAHLRPVANLINNLRS